MIRHNIVPRLNEFWTLTTFHPGIFPFSNPHLPEFSYPQNPENVRPYSSTSINSIINSTLLESTQSWKSNSIPISLLLGSVTEVHPSPAGVKGHEESRRSRLGDLLIKVYFPLPKSYRILISGRTKRKRKKSFYHLVYTYQTVKIAVSQSKPNQNGFWQVQNRSSFRVIICKQRLYQTLFNFCLV